ncbi:MAG: LamG domain-containing protein [Anaerolineales bacterium]|nr:LamG domain-containing protein [Anaerolineales bacterium]
MNPKNRWAGFILITFVLGVSLAAGVAELSSAAAPTPTSGPTILNIILPGMRAWWMAENNANDSMGLYDGVLMNGVTFAPGKVGSAFSLDGSDDYIVIPNGVITATARNFTVEAWIYLNATDNQWHMMVYGGSDAGEYHLALDELNRFNFGVKLVDWNWYNVTAPAITDTWVHLAAVRRGTSIELWVDGVLADSVAIPDLDLYAAGNEMNNARIGAYNEFFTQHKDFWDGLLDEISLYDQALSAGEILAIYQADSAGKGYRILLPLLVE